MALFAVVVRVAGISVVSIATDENSVTPIPPGIAERTPSNIPAERIVARMGSVTEMPNAAAIK